MLAEDSDSAASSGDEMLDMVVPFSQQSASTSPDKSVKSNKGSGSEDDNNDTKMPPTKKCKHEDTDFTSENIDEAESEKKGVCSWL